MPIVSLDDQSLGDYENELYAILLTNEQRFFPLKGRSPQLTERGRLLELIRNAADSLTLSNTSVHVAVRLLDLFMDNHRVDVTYLSLVALAAIYISSKFEDLEINVPLLSDMQTLSPVFYRLEDFMAMEIVLLDFFQWDMSVMTVAHFSEYFASRMVTVEDDLGKPHRSQTCSLRCAVLDRLKYLVEISLDDLYYASTWFPSAVAASCVLAARSSLGVSPVWPPHMVRVSTYSAHTLQTCTHRLLRSLHDQMEEVHEASSSNDSGFHTANDSVSTTASDCNDNVAMQHAELSAD